MNVILEGLDAAGKTTLAEKLRDKFGMKIIHSTSKTRNDLNYHLDLLDYQNNTVFDRFSVGEFVYPKIYGRDPKIADDEFKIIEKRIIDNNDLFIIFITSNMNIINERLIARNEYEYLKEMNDQNILFSEYAKKFRDKYRDYKNFYVIDVALPDAYNKLDEWIDSHFGKITPNIAYKKLANDLLDYGKPIDSSNPRGSTYELCNYQFVIDDISGNECVTLKTGNTNLTYVAAELLWYWSARNDVKFISKFSAFWNKVSDDGKTANSAYGYILQKKHGFNQIEKIIELLKYDPNSRRAVLNINVPNENVIETKDEMCTICLNYQIRNGKLHSTCVLRSNDFNFGLRNDLPFFISVQKYIADRLGLEYGSYTHYAFSMHMYSKDVEFAKNIAYGTMETINKRLDIKKLIDHKDELIDWIDNKFNVKTPHRADNEMLEILKEYRDKFTEELIKLGIIYEI